MSTPTVDRVAIPTISSTNGDRVTIGSVRSEVAVIISGTESLSEKQMMGERFATGVHGGCYKITGRGWAGPVGNPGGGSSDRIRARALEDTRSSEVLRITPDNRIILVPPVAEMGQNVITSLAALVAEELEVDWSRVEVEIAPHHPDFYNVRVRPPAIVERSNLVRTLETAGRRTHGADRGGAQRRRVPVAELQARGGASQIRSAAKPPPMASFARPLPRCLCPHRQPAITRYMAAIATQTRKDGVAKVTELLNWSRRAASWYGLCRSPDGTGPRRCPFDQTPPSHPTC